MSHRLDNTTNTPDSSRKYFQQSLSIAEEIGDKTTLLSSSCYLAALTVKVGDFDGGVKQMRGILDETNSHEDAVLKIVVRRLLGQALLEHGASEANKKVGRTILQEALSLATEQGYAHEIGWISGLLNKEPSR